MKIMLIILLCFSCASAESVVPDFTERDMNPIYEFAEEYSADDMLRNLYESASSGGKIIDIPIVGWLKQQLHDPARTIMKTAAELLPSILLSALLHCAVGRKAAGALFLIRLVMISGFSSAAMIAMNASADCLDATVDFINVAAPVLTSLLTAIGMEGTASMVSPAAALAGNAAGTFLAGCGLPLCRFSLCIAIAGNIGGIIQTARITRILRKTVSWCAGLSITIFTASVVLQGNISQGLDNVALKTARFAVDSASPIIGSGVSDAWESYISGMAVVKNAVGVSGIAAVLAFGLKPLISSLLSMLMLHFAAAILGLFGEDAGVAASEEIAGVCQMALSLCTASLTIAMVLLGAVMSIRPGPGS